MLEYPLEVAQKRAKTRRELESKITELERQVSDLTAERDRWDKLVTAIDFIQVRVSAIEGTFAVISHDRIGELWEVDNELERNQYISPIEAYESIK